MVKSICLLLFILYFSHSIFGQQELLTENIILVTYDGLRWQEVFTGAEKRLMNDKKFVKDPKLLANKYWDDNPDIRRHKVMPFMWSVLHENGQIFGNRKYGNKVNVSNIFWFSYPGYNEMLTGLQRNVVIFANIKRNNPNITILEYLNTLPDYHEKVAAFGSWDLIPYVLNRKRCGFFINAGHDHQKIEAHDSINELFVSHQEHGLAPGKSIRLDILTHRYAMKYLRKHAPKIMFISYGETDDIAHNGRYDLYLDAITRTDRFIEEIWNYVQSTPQYRNKTTMIITTDHGRGSVFQKSWKRHGRMSPGSGQIWFAIIGPDTEPLGEIRFQGQFYLSQVARTIAAFLNVNYNIYSNSGDIIEQVIRSRHAPKNMFVAKSPE